jgi:hypothetical protein
MLKAQTLFIAALGTLFVTTTSPLALAQNLDTSGFHKIVVIKPQDLPGVKGVEPWNPEGNALNACEQLDSLKSPDTIFSSRYWGAYARCNELLLETVILQNGAGSASCDPDITAMLKKQLLVNSRTGLQQILVNTPNSRTVLAGLKCLGETK